MNIGNSLSQSIKSLRDLLRTAERAVVFTGAGISTESGIPDFRGPNGIWKTTTPIYFDEFIRSESRRRESWRNLLGLGAGLFDKQPNRGHHAVSRLVDSGKVAAVITQNVDGLHQASGVPAGKLIELHGNITFARCLDCGKRYEIDDIREQFFPDETVPYCDVCHGIVKVAAISFGEAMPEHAMLEADRVTRDCDCFVVLGSSLTVYPAASFPEQAKRLGAYLIIVNQQPTGLDDVANLVIHARIGDTLSAIL